MGQTATDERIAVRLAEATPALPLAERVAGNLRAELGRRKLSGRDFARAMGWPRTTAARRLSGESPLSIPELEAVAAVFGMTVTELLA